MTRIIRSRRTRRSRDQPLYARMLHLRHLAPSGFLCFVFLEGAIALGILLALAELVSWWGVLVLPITVAAMVKLNDVVAGLLARPSAPESRPTRADVARRRERTVDLRGSLLVPEAAEFDAGTVKGPAGAGQRANQLHPRQPWARQSANRRYQ